MESPENGDASPKVLGVVEKNDSVSWVLEMDESPLAVASRMLRRASSLRGDPTPKKKSSDAQHSLTLPSRKKKSSNSSTSSSKSVKDGVEKNSSIMTEANVDTEEKTDALTAATKENEDENVIVDISSFFAFLQDSDFETDLVVSDDVDARETFFSGAGKGSASTYSSSSSDSSLDLEVYEKDSKSRRYTWTKNSDGAMVKAGVVECGVAAVTYSSSTSDTEDSESVGSFSASPARNVSLQLVNNSTNSNE